MGKRDKGVLTGEPATYQTPSPAGDIQMETFIPWKLVKRGVRRQVITPINAPEQFQSEASAKRREREAARRSGQDRPLIRALGLAHYWQRLLDEGKYLSLTEIAAGEGLDLGQASRIARLAQLAPDIVEACVTGPDTGLALEHLSRRGIAAMWVEQRGDLMQAYEIQ